MITRYITEIIVLLLDAALLNAVYLAVLRPRVRVFKSLPARSQDGVRTWHVTVQNFEESALEGDLVVRVTSSDQGGMTAYRSCAVRALVGPGELTWTFDTSAGDKVDIHARSFRALKTWTFIITRQGDGEIDAQVFFRPSRTALYDIGRRVDYGAKYEKIDGRSYFAWDAQPEKDGPSGILDGDFTPDFRALAISVFFTAATYVSLCLFLLGTGVAEIISTESHRWAASSCVLATVFAFFMIRRPLFPVAQGYREIRSLGWPASPTPWAPKPKQEYRPPRVLERWRRLLPGVSPKTRNR